MCMKFPTRTRTWEMLQWSLRLSLADRNKGSISVAFILMASFPVMPGTGGNGANGQVDPGSYLRRRCRHHVRGSSGQAAAADRVSAGAQFLDDRLHLGGGAVAARQPRQRQGTLSLA